MSTFLERATFEAGVSVVASTMVAVMVLAAGLALETVPGNPTIVWAAPEVDGDSALVMCREDRFGYRCIPEES
jgi:hypothetical protein